MTPRRGSPAIRLLALAVAVAGVALGIGSRAPLDGHAAAAGCPGARSGHPSLPGIFFAGDPSAQAITVEQARAVVSAFWPLEEKALVSKDVALTDALESGAAAEYNDTVTCDLLAGSRSLRTVRPMSFMKLFIPPQAGYPARFLAAVQTVVYPDNLSDTPPGTPLVELLVFVRSGPTQPWRADLETGFTGSMGDAGSLTVTPGSALVEDPPHIGWVDVASVPGLLAQYWQHWVQVGGPPSGSNLLPGAWTTIQGEALEAGKVKSTEIGVLKHVRYFADLPRDGLYEFSAGAGAELACFVTRATDRLTPSYGALVQDRRRVNYGTALAPGAYAAITVGSLHQSCALLPPTPVAGPDGPGIAIIGGTGGQTSIAGEPAVLAGAPGAAAVGLARIAAVLLLAALLTIGIVLLATRRRGPPALVHPASPVSWPVVLLSPDRRFWWDGSGWVDAGMRAPQRVPRSPDGAWWWDGLGWRPVPPGADSTGTSR